MAGSQARRTDPELWEKVKDEVTKSDKGGRKGQWSARKAQHAVQEYKKRGGGYAGEQPDDNSLKRWTEEDWGTKSGKKSTQTGERYLPKKAREQLSDEEYRKTTAKKRSDTKKGRQFSGQPEAIREKTAKHRSRGQRGRSDDAPTKAELYDEAKRRAIPGRSKMGRDDLLRALGRS